MKESRGARDLVDWLEARELTLLNTLGIGTFYRPNLVRPNVLDLTFVTKAISNKVQD